MEKQYKKDSKYLQNRNEMWVKSRLILVHQDLKELIAYIIDQRLSKYELATKRLVTTPNYYLDLLAGNWGAAMLNAHTFHLLNQFYTAFATFCSEEPLNTCAAIAFSHSKYQYIRTKLIIAIRELEADFMEQEMVGWVSFRKHKYRLSPETEDLLRILNDKLTDLIIKEDSSPALIKSLSTYIKIIEGEG